MYFQLLSYIIHDISLKDLTSIIALIIAIYGAYLSTMNYVTLKTKLILNLLTDDGVKAVGGHLDCFYISTSIKTEEHFGFYNGNIIVNGIRFNLRDTGSYDDDSQLYSAMRGRKYMLVDKVNISNYLKDKEIKFNGKKRIKFSLINEFEEEFKTNYVTFNLEKMEVTK